MPRVPPVTRAVRPLSENISMTEGILAKLIPKSFLVHGLEETGTLWYKHKALVLSITVEDWICCRCLSLHEQLRALRTTIVHPIGPLHSAFCRTGSPAR